MQRVRRELFTRAAFFDDAGAGAYLIEVTPTSRPRVQGDYLTRFIVVADPLKTGQGLAT
jgi:hypothetical protein